MQCIAIVITAFHVLNYLSRINCHALVKAFSTLGAALFVYCVIWHACSNSSLDFLLLALGNELQPLLNLDRFPGLPGSRPSNRLTGDGVTCVVFCHRILIKLLLHAVFLRVHHHLLFTGVLFSGVDLGDS